MASQEELDRLKEIRELERELAGIRSETLNDVRDMSNFLSDSASSLKLEVAERNQIRSIARQINKVAQESYTISLNELGTSQNLAKIQKDREGLENKIISLNQLKNKLIEDGGENQIEISNNIEKQVESTQKLLAELKEVEDESADIKNNLGVKGFAVTEDIVGAIPGLRQFKGTFSDAADAARGIAASGGSAAQAFAAGAKSISKAAVAALPLLVFTELVKAFTQLDNSSGKIAKNLGISYDQASAINREFTGIAATSGNIFVTTQNLGEAFVSINDTLGTNGVISEDLLVTQTELVKQAGYSVEAATQLATLSLATGQSSKDITTEFLGQVKALNLQNNLAINEKTLLESIAKTSKGTLATFSAQPEALANAAFEAKKLGLELSQVEKIADGLLDIEQSLTAEFEAEVITGRQLNLERARFFALTNDLAGVSKELASQDITRASFAKANRIEQDAIAASLGMSRDQMGEMLLEQEALTKLSGIEGATAQERFNNLVKEVGLEEAKRKIGEDTLANQLASVNTQEQFAQVVSKLQEVFVQVVSPLMPLLSLAGKIISFITPILPTLTAIAGFLTGNPFLVAAGGAAIYSQIQGVDDGMAPASKGPFTITDSFGATAITAKGDSLAVSPNIRRDDRNTGTTIDYDKLADAIAKGAEKGTSRATVVTNLDGDRISNRLQPSLAVNTRRYSV
jgi:hypothetical protein